MASRAMPNGRRASQRPADPRRPSVHFIKILQTARSQFGFFWFPSLIVLSVLSTLNVCL